MRQEKFKLKSNELDLIGYIETPDEGEFFPTVLLLHGGTNTMDKFPPFPFLRDSLIDEGFMCVRFDFYGSGESDGDFRDKTNDLMYNNIKDVLDFISKDSRCGQIGTMSRSQSSIQMSYFLDDRIKARALHCPPIRPYDSYAKTWYPKEMAEFMPSQEKYLMIDDPNRDVKGPYGYNRTYFEELLTIPDRIDKSLPQMNNVCIIEGAEDDEMDKNDAWLAFNFLTGHRQFHCIADAPHNFKGKEIEVASLSLEWFKKHLINS